MTAEKKTMAFGWRVHGLGVMSLGMAGLAFGAFDPGQPLPENFSAGIALAHAAGASLVVAARTAAWGAAALTVYYALFVVIMMNAAGGPIVYATTARIDAVLAEGCVVSAIG
jgi:hypothetical protein